MSNQQSSIRYRAAVVVMVLAMAAGIYACDLPDSQSEYCPMTHWVCPPGFTCSPDQTFCILRTCGNGKVQEHEQCDDGNRASGDGCSADCQSDETCGNGYVDQVVGEVCDDGNTQAGDGCSDVCQSEGCGNGRVDVALGEECDDGNGNNEDACPDGAGENGEPPGTCMWARCGDGFVWAGVESCDDGNGNDNDGCPDGPGGTCREARCGDGAVCSDPATCTVLEECDEDVDGNGAADDTASCDSDCTAAWCGDGYWNQENGEECDDTAGKCDWNCRIQGICGDGVLDPGEQCDDGNQRNSDICPDGPGGTCELAQCGDGFVWSSYEQCDDGNASNTDSCPSGPGGTCQFARCGDGFVRSGYEQCDDGNSITTDSCPSGSGGTCRPARCGDGFVWSGVEQCDDGNASNSDDCPSGLGGTCEPARCGDGFLRSNPANTANTEECERSSDCSGGRSCNKEDCRCF